jgi:hypothetical protein
MPPDKKSIVEKIFKGSEVIRFYFSCYAIFSDVDSGFEFDAKC